MIQNSDEFMNDEDLNEEEYITNDMEHVSRQYSHFTDIKRSGEPRHRGKHCFHYNNNHHHPPDSNYPHLNKNQPHITHNECDRNRYPVSGQMQENAFMLLHTTPYLWDNTGFRYGQRISVGESVYTRILQRRDPSCINLTGVFDMTQSMDNNITLNYYIEQIIKNQLHQLQGLLPIIKSQIDYKIFYTISDLSGGIVHESSVFVTSQEHRFHSTNVKDYYLISDSNVVIAHIPQIDFQGPYILTLEKVEASIPIIDTQNYVQNFLNPFYQWTQNNQKIYLDNAVISRQQPDYTLTIAESDIKFSTQFDGNLTTKLKISFTAFLSNIIATHNTFQIWQSLYDVDGSVIRTMKNDIINLKKDTHSLDEDLTCLEERVVITEEDIKVLKGEEIPSEPEVNPNPDTGETISEQIEKPTPEPQT